MDEKRQEKIKTYIFLTLSLFSGFFEIGGVLWAVRVGKPVYFIVGMGLMYQLGNMVPVPVKINRRIAIGLLTASLAAAVLVRMDIVSDMLMLPIMCFVACAIQHMRSVMKEKVGTTIKRIFRVLGFIVAPFFSILTCIICIGVLSVLAFTSKKENKIGAEIIRCEITPINIIMIVHQMHYFGYVYFMLVILDSFVTASHMVIGILFVIGWITYLIVPHILRGKRFFLYFISGHFFLSLILLGLALNYNTVSAAILWILTGFGGGTVFCVKKINDIYSDCNSNDIVFSENVGHILGTTLGLVAFYVFHSLQAPIIFSMCCAITACVSMFGYRIIKTVKMRESEWLQD